MSFNTTTTLVQSILGSNYGPLPDGTFPDLQQYIDTAHLIVVRTQAAALAKIPTVILIDPELEMMERHLSAHYYCRMDPLYTSKSTGGGSGSFASPKDEAERYKQNAIEVDYSGMLKAILNRQTAGGVWLGKPVSAQIPYDQRN